MQNLLLILSALQCLFKKNVILDFFVLRFLFLQLTYSPIEQYFALYYIFYQKSTQYK